MKAKLILISLSMLAATQATAAVITFGGQTPIDGSQQTSNFVPSSAWITPGGAPAGGAVTNLSLSAFYTLLKRIPARRNDIIGVKHEF